MLEPDKSVFNSDGAFDMVVEKAEAGDPVSKFLAGKGFLSNHVSEETERAVRWIKEAADAGLEDAQVYIEEHSELFD